MTVVPFAPRSKAAHYADLLASSRDPRDVSLREEYLAQTYDDLGDCAWDSPAARAGREMRREAVKADEPAPVAPVRSVQWHGPEFDAVAPPHTAALVILSALAVFAALVIGAFVWGV